MKRGRMTKPIPEKLKQEMADDRFFEKCCIGDMSCNGVIQFHHNLIFAGKRQDVGILPLCEYHHRHEKDKTIKDKLNWIMLNRMSYQQLSFYSKAENLYNKLERLNKIYGDPRGKHTKCDL